MQTLRLVEGIVLIVATLQVLHALIFESKSNAKEALKILVGTAAMFVIIELAFWWVGC